MNTGMELMMMFSPTIREIIEMEKKRAVLAEREACAKICEAEGSRNDGITCAELIRDRK